MRRCPQLTVSGEQCGHWITDSSRGDCGRHRTQRRKGRATATVPAGDVRQVADAEAFDLPDTQPAVPVRPSTSPRTVADVASAQQHERQAAEGVAAIVLLRHPDARDITIVSHDDAESAPHGLRLDAVRVPNGVVVERGELAPLERAMRDQLSTLASTGLVGSVARYRIDGGSPQRVI